MVGSRMSCGSGVKAQRLALLKRLSPRQREVARLVCQGLQHKEIARELGISPRTVNEYLHGARGRLGVHSTVELAVRFTELKLAA